MNNYSLPHLLQGGLALTNRSQSDNIVAEELYRKVFQLIPDSLNINRMGDGLYVSINRGFSRIMEYSESEVIGKTSIELNIWVHPARRDQMIEILNTHGWVHNFEARFRSKSGVEIDGLMSATVFLLDGVPHIVSLTRDITESKKLEFSLREKESEYLRLADNLPVSVCTFTPDGLLTFVNQTMATSRSLTREEMIGLNIFDQLNPSDLLSLQQGLQSLTPESPTETHEQVHRHSNGNYGVEQWSNRGFFDNTGKPVHYQAIGEDISERKRAARELQIAATAFESSVGIAITDTAQMVLQVNHSFTEITGYKAEEVVGRTLDMLSSGRHGPDFFAAIWNAVEQSGKWEGEVWNRRKSGEIYPEWLTITSVKDVSGKLSHYVETFTDITSRKTAESQINKLAFYDPLTLLPNRRLLADRTRQALASSARSARDGALLLIDLDYFKTLNDTHGHDNGDLLLKEVARRVSECVPEGDTVGRLGGDEFVVLLENLADQSLEAANLAEDVAERILTAIRQPYELAGQHHNISASIGIALFLASKNSSKDLMKCADMAMYKAKSDGRNCWCFYDPEMQAEVSARAALESGLREALRQQHFQLYFQPQMEANGLVTGAEGLIRWLDPKRGIVAPGEFIPLAESTGLILPIGHWVLQSACAQLKQWESIPGLRHLTLSVNVSARQFHQEHFVEQVLQLLHFSGCNPNLLKLELTESLMVDNVEVTIRKMLALKNHGIQFSLDDFGTGYSSLYHLKRLPLDQLKIDQSFVRDILVDPNDAAIARMVISLAETMGLSVIAEGVETHSQCESLKLMGCDKYQGYLFGRPVSIDQFESLACVVRQP